MPTHRTPLHHRHTPAAALYRRVLQVLSDAGMSFLVGGAHAYAVHTGISRPTKDLDLFVRRADYDAIAGVLQAAGFVCELTFPHWLAKVHTADRRAGFVDLIFNSGNGAAEVDDDWFAHAVDGSVLDVPVRMAPAEEIIWSKAYVMERERYDGADVAHLLRARAEHIDWQRLLRRFGPHWRVLLCHLTLFGFIYPQDRTRVPPALIDLLTDRLRHEAHALPPHLPVCDGTLLSREQYLHDVQRQGLRDGREAPLGPMSPAEVAGWTDAIGRDDA